MIEGIRRCKGARALPPIAPAPIALDGKFDDWKNVTPEFRDTIGDVVHRAAEGYDKAVRLTNQTGRNDLIAAKVSYDATNVYFYIRTKEAITPPTDPNWMLLFINADADPKTGWLGYDFVVNRKHIRPGVTTLQSHAAGKGYEWSTPVEVEYRLANNEMELAIPRTALGVKTLPATIDFNGPTTSSKPAKPAISP